VSAGVVGIGLFLAHLLDASLDPDLPAQRHPVERERSLGIGQQFAALSAFIVGVEHKPVRPIAFQKNHAQRRLSVRIGRGQGNGGGFLQA